MEKVNIPTREETEREARLLCMKLLLSGDRFTLRDMGKLNEILAIEGSLK